MVAPNSSAPVSDSGLLARDKAVADAALLQAQQRVSCLAAITLNFQTPPLDQTFRPALKVPPPPVVPIPCTIVSAPAGYRIPKKADAPVDLSKHVAKHHYKSSGKHSKTSRRHKKHSKKPKKSGKPKKDAPSRRLLKPYFIRVLKL